jgi:hypothetical protein
MCVNLSNVIRIVQRGGDKPNVIKLGDFWVVGAAFQQRFQLLGESFLAAGKRLD